MPVRKEHRRGHLRLVIDIPYTTPDGRKARYRKDAPIQTLTAARIEERRLLSLLAQHGTPIEPPPEIGPAEPPEPLETPEPATPTKPAATPIPSSPPTPTFSTLVTDYRATFMLTDLKITTRRGYTSILESLLLPRFGHLPITHIDSAAASILDLDLSKRRLSQSTRNNAQIVLRSVLRFAASRGILPHSVTNLPRLKPIGQGILEIPTDCNIQTLLTLAAPSHRLAFALMAFAGLRPNEVRALRRRDILLRYENNNKNPIGGFLSIREVRPITRSTHPRPANAKSPSRPPSHPCSHTRARSPVTPSSP